MKTEKIKNAILTLFCVVMVVSLGACTSDEFERNVGTLPDEDALGSVSGKLRSPTSSDNEQELGLTEGDGFVVGNFRYEITQPMATDLKLETTINADLVAAYNETNETNYLLLPIGNYEFPDGKSIIIEKGKKRSAIKRVKFLAGTLAPGNYLLPLTIATSATQRSPQEVVLYYTLSIRERYVGPHVLNTPEADTAFIYMVFYINTNEYDPRLVQDYIMERRPRRKPLIWRRTVGNLINLRITTLNTDDSGRALLNLGEDMSHILENATKYIRPLQDEGRNVSLCIEGGGTGLGFCNLNDLQIADFVTQVKMIIETYKLDGINLWDQNAGYGKEGMPPMNTTSYPKLIVAMHTMLKALGSDKLLTVTDHMEPTEYFWDTAATGGIEVGKYLDFAWSGYRGTYESIQILDPWHSNIMSEDGRQLISKYTHKAFAGLDPKKYGCINVPWRPGAQTDEELLMFEFQDIYEWGTQGGKQSNILVYEDLRTHRQDKFEFSWGLSGAYSSFALDGFPSTVQMGYSHDIQPLTIISETFTGYGKWVKDW